jgi:hypothetical protein
MINIETERGDKVLLIEDSERVVGSAFVKIDDRHYGIGFHVPASLRIEAAKELAGAGVLVVELPEIEDQIVTNHMRFGDSLAKSEEYHLRQLAVVREARRRLAEQPKRDPDQVRLLTEAFDEISITAATPGLVEALYDKGVRVNA